MILQPITNIRTLEDLAKISAPNNAQSPEIPFKSMFMDAINDVKASNEQLAIEIEKVVSGETDDLHNVNIASAKAALSLEMVVQLRNKALEAYNSIMQMGV